MNKEQFKLLADKYVNGVASEEEISLLMKIYRQYQDVDMEWDSELMGNQEKVSFALFAKITAEIDKNKRIKSQIPVYKLSFFRYAVAAVILISLSIGFLFIKHRPESRQQTASVNDVAPARNQAILTLAGGKKIYLSGKQRGRLAQQGNTVIQVNNNSAINYLAATVPQDVALPILYNTLSTGRGDQSPFPLVLADGTKVWLDAASSITFPTAFGGPDRIVKLNGEAYFEVAHDAKHPFKVVTKRQTITDVGTTFNVNAYEDEPELRTTLISGIIDVSITAAESEKVRLKPGQSAVTKANQPGISVVEENIDHTMAWKNGLFSFKKADIQTVMRQISRWYNVDVTYEGKIPARIFSGDIHRNLNASQVLEVLSYYNVHFKIVGNKITVNE